MEEFIKISDLDKNYISEDELKKAIFKLKSDILILKNNKKFYIAKLKKTKKILKNSKKLNKSQIKNNKIKLG